MGYRTRLGRVAKDMKQKVAGMTVEQAHEFAGESGSLYYPSWHTELYELGKYCNFEEEREPFYDFDVYEECESEFDILTKEGLKAIIEDYHANIHKVYKATAEADDKERRILIEGLVREWETGPFSITPYYLDEPEEKCDGSIVRSWRYEYSIFNLVYIYRTFDWENDYLIISAW